MGQIKINVLLIFKFECYFRIQFRRFINVNKFKLNILNFEGVKIKQNLYEINIVYYIVV